MDIKKIIVHLADHDRVVDDSNVIQLSGLSQGDLKKFFDIWKSVSSSDRTEVLNKLLKLSNNRPVLDFTDIFKMCLNDDDENVRSNAILGLWECDDKTFMRFLINMMLSDDSSDVRYVAAASLGRFVDMAREDKLSPINVSKLLGALFTTINMRDELVYVRGRAVESIASFQSDKVDDVIQDLYNSEDYNLCISSIAAMGRTSNSFWLPMVLSHIYDHDPSMRTKVAVAIGEIGDESSVYELAKLIEDDELDVQLAAISGLAKIGGSDAIIVLKKCLDCEDKILVNAATNGLGMIKTEDSLANIDSTS